MNADTSISQTSSKPGVLDGVGSVSVKKKDRWRKKKNPAIGAHDELIC